MRLFTSTKTIGVTVKFVVEADADQAHAILESLPSEITIGGERLSTVRLGVDGLELEPARVSLCREDMSSEEEDTFLEDC
jgi:hypothetical protein